MSYQERFDAFHRDNPHVYDVLVRMARQLKAAGRERYGINALCEALRFHTSIQTTGDVFKLNNSLRPFYSRLIMERERDLAGFFEVRERWAA